MKDDISPEERLLKLIRSPKKQDAQDLSGQKKPVSVTTTPDLKPTVRTSVFSSAQKYFSFVYFQKIISVVFIIAGIYFIFSFIHPWLGFKKNGSPSITEAEIMQPDNNIELKEEEVRPYEYYLEGIKDRRIFGSLSQPEKPITTAPALEANADLIKNMNLVGIISGENPQAVIEDKKVNKTYYVTKGQFIGEFQIEDIQEGKVTLNYHERRYELYL